MNKLDLQTQTSQSQAKRALIDDLMKKEMSKEESRFVEFQLERIAKIKTFVFGWKNLEDKFIEPLQAREGSTLTFVGNAVQGSEP